MRPAFLARPAAAALLFVALGGCASLAGRRQYLSIDSSPRGLEVLDPEDHRKVLGTTPLFVRLRRDTSHDLRLRAPAGTEWTTPMSCGFRWRGALLGNLPMTLLGGSLPGALVMYGVGNAVDLATGAAWACPPRFHVDAAWTARPDAPPPVPACPALVAVPPRADDQKLSDLVAARWKARLVAAGTCATFADEERVQDFYRRYNVTHDTPFEPAQADPERLNELGFLTGATHAVVLRTTGDDRFVKVTPVRYDLHTLAEAREPAFDLDLDAEPGLTRSGALAVVARYLRLLPNSVAFSAAQKSFDFQAVATTRLVGDQPTKSVLPSVLSNWTVAWVEHPDRHGAWDATFGLSPTLAFGYNARLLSLTDADGGRPRTLAASIVHGVVLYDASVGLHTPLGAFGMAAGAGAGGAWLWEDGRFRSWTFGAFANARVDYTAFVSENLFLQVAYDAYQSRLPHVVGNGYSLVTFQAASVTVGCYLPQLRSVVRGLF